MCRLHMLTTLEISKDRTLNDWGLPMKRAMLLFLIVAFAGVATAQTPSHPALTGKVTSQAEGAMEGVLVGAKKVGSPITTWVVSNAQGQYSFPRDRITPGKYAMSIRAVGYELPTTSVDV